MRCGSDNTSVWPRFGGFLVTVIPRLPLSSHRSTNLRSLVCSSPSARCLFCSQHTSSSSGRGAHRDELWNCQPQRLLLRSGIRKMPAPLAHRRSTQRLLTCCIKRCTTISESLPACPYPCAERAISQLWFRRPVPARSEEFSHRRNLHHSLLVTFLHGAVHSLDTLCLQSGWTGAALRLQSVSVAECAQICYRVWYASALLFL